MRSSPGSIDPYPAAEVRAVVSTGGTIHHHGQRITIRLDRRTYSPVLRSADLPDTTIPW
jgi:hypothetical protein